MNIFKRARTAPDLVLKACNAYEELSRNAGSQSALDHLVKYVGEMKVCLFGEAGEKPAKEEESKALATEAAKSNLLALMCQCLAPLGFEVRAQPRVRVACRSGAG